MMGERLLMQESLFYEFRLEDHVPSDHLLRRIDRFVDCSGGRVPAGGNGSEPEKARQAGHFTKASDDPRSLRRLKGYTSSQS